MNHYASDMADSRHRYAVVFVVSFLLWLLLVGTLQVEELIAGLAVSAAVSALFAPRFEIFSGLRLSPRLPLDVLAYLGDFLVALVRANLELARRILSPSLPINPAFVEIRTGLKSPLGRMLLANTITLTPGTLTVDVEDDRLLVHWVYCPPGTDILQATEQIATSFEEHLSRFLL